jgi:hypothetical protein
MKGIFVPRKEDNMGTVNIGEAIKGIENVANDKYDGHYTIMKFSTGYKVIFGTPDLSDTGRAQIRQLRTYDNLVTAIINAVFDEDKP